MQPAERALAESPLNICGIPIKNLTMVEDRDAYYRTKHATTRAALLQVWVHTAKTLATLLSCALP